MHLFPKLHVDCDTTFRLTANQTRIESLQSSNSKKSLFINNLNYFMYSTVQYLAKRFLKTAEDVPKNSEVLN